MGNVESLAYFIPEILVIGLILVVIIFDLFKDLKILIFPVVIGGLVFTGFCLYYTQGISESIFLDMIVVDSYSHFFKYLFIIATLFITVVSKHSLEVKKIDQGEYFTLLLTVLLGLMLMVSSMNLIMIYLAIEVVSIASYILAGMKTANKASNEASLKYVIFGSFASGIMLYGMSWLYGISGSTNIVDIHDSLMGLGEDNFTIYMSIIFLLAGIGYKISMVPFHYWTPDVYEGAPTPITAFFSVAPKAAGIALFIRVMHHLFTVNGVVADTQPILNVDWQFLIAVLSAGTMTIGNFLAIQQKNVKRILAYSSIAHAGYMLMAATILSENAVKAIMFYLVVYLFMNLGAFIFAIFISNKLGVENVDEYKGVGFRTPLNACLMVIFLVSLTGLPPSAGFVGKVYLFSALIESKTFYWLAVVGILNSVVSLFYYFNIAKSLWLEDPTDEGFIKPHPAIGTIIFICCIPTVLFGLKWDSLTRFIDSAFQF